MSFEHEEGSASLLYTPTWAVASVFSIFILCSLAVERGIFFIGYVFRKHHQNSLSEALEKIKEELMVVGFFSLALTVGQKSVIQICIPSEWTDIMPQCRRPTEHEAKAKETIFAETSTETSFDGQICPKGKVPFILVEGLHQLHVLLFILAIVHVIYCVMIMALGMWKVHQWKAWEERARAAENLRDYGRIRLTRDVTFIRRHATGLWTRNIVLAYLGAFFKQFCRSVSETDYRTLRHGFIKKHNLKGFDFHKYICRALEDDFKNVVGISPSLWGYTVLLTLLNVDGWGMYLWASTIPLILVLTVGAKLRHIITQMAVHCFEKHAVVEGLPDIKPNDELFWFKSPRLILYLLHFIIYQDALEVSLHIWSAYVFPKSNCFHRHRYVLVGRLLLGALAQLICGYIMLPIYALVSQMGSQMKGDNRQGWKGNHEEAENPVKTKEDKLQSSHDSKSTVEHDEYELDIIDLEDQGGRGLQRKVSFMQRVSCSSSPNDFKELRAQNSFHDGENISEDIKEENEQGGRVLRKKVSFLQRVSSGNSPNEYLTLKHHSLSGNESMTDDTRVECEPVTRCLRKKVSFMQRVSGGSSLDGNESFSEDIEENEQGGRSLQKKVSFLQRVSRGSSSLEYQALRPHDSLTGNDSTADDLKEENEQAGRALHKKVSFLERFSHGNSAAEYQSLRPHNGDEGITDNIKEENEPGTRALQKKVSFMQRVTGGNSSNE